jgi:hypothetical protein
VRLRGDPYRRTRVQLRQQRVEIAPGFLARWSVCGHSQEGTKDTKDSMAHRASSHSAPEEFRARNYWVVWGHPNILSRCRLSTECEEVWLATESFVSFAPSC